MNGTTSALGNGAHVQVAQCEPESPNQLWAWNGTANGWQLPWTTAASRKSHSGLCLDVADGNHTAGAEVQLWSCNGGENQMFGWKKFVGITYANSAVSVDEIKLSW